LPGFGQARPLCASRWRLLFLNVGDGPEKFLETLEVWFRNFRELDSNPETRCAGGDDSLRPQLHLFDPNADLQFLAFLERDRHFDVAATLAEVGGLAPDQRSLEGMQFDRGRAFQAGIFAALRRGLLLWPVFVDTAGRNREVP
jgi:hypothetical protein